MSSRQHQAISVAECEEFRDCFEAGDSVGQIADEYDRGRTTVRRHVHDHCTHALKGGQWGGSHRTECPLCGEEMYKRKLTRHLPKCPANDRKAAAANEGGRA